MRDGVWISAHSDEDNVFVVRLLPGNKRLNVVQCGSDIGWKGSSAQERGTVVFHRLCHGGRDHVFLRLTPPLTS